MSSIYFLNSSSHQSLPSPSGIEVKTQDALQKNLQKITNGILSNTLSFSEQQRIETEIRDVMEVTSPPSGLLQLVFFCSVIAQEVTLVSRLLVSGRVEVDAIDPGGRTALQRACMAGFTDMALDLLTAGANVDLQDCNGASPLHLAVSEEQSHIVQLLLSKRANIEVENKNGLRPLHLAAEKNNALLFFMLLEGKADVSAVTNDENRLNALHLACLHGYESIVEEIFCFRLIQFLDFRDKEASIRLSQKVRPIPTRTTIVEFPAEVGHVESKSISTEESDCKSPPTLIESESKKGMRPLHIAAGKGFLSTCKVLLKYGADVNALNGDGESALFIACRKNNLPIAGELVTAGATIEPRMLEIAKEKGFSSIVELLSSKVSIQSH